MADALAHFVATQPPLATAQSRGRTYTSYPFVFGLCHGPNAALRAAFMVEVLKIPNWAWNDRTGNLRASVQLANWNLVAMGGASTFYAVYIEAALAPMRRAYQAALDVYGYGNVSSGNLNRRAA